ncbi:IRF3 factor, partial [Menura novaehollandiae]|nr:IRF3 factor [Menura novaehollandiae]
ARREGQKLLFGPWLLNAISSGKYRGLCWIDPECTIFRVPWKHNARKDITSSDLEVFKVGGMRIIISNLRVFKVGGVGVISSNLRWKTNFRCALRSTHMFRLEEDHSKRGDDPHKVF